MSSTVSCGTVDSGQTVALRATGSCCGLTQSRVCLYLHSTRSVSGPPRGFVAARWTHHLQFLSRLYDRSFVHESQVLARQVLLCCTRRWMERCQVSFCGISDVSVLRMISGRTVSGLCLQGRRSATMCAHCGLGQLLPIGMCFDWGNGERGEPVNCIAQSVCCAAM
jgi:hypothetical protein